LKNLVRTDEKTVGNHFSTSIVVDDVEYLVEYFASNHLLYKTPNKTLPSTFRARISNKKTAMCKFVINDKTSGLHETLWNINITMFVKLRKKNSIDNKYKWFAVISSFNQVIKTGQLFEYVFYSIDETNCKISNEDDTIVIKDFDMKKTEIEGINKDILTVFLSTGKDGELKLVKKDTDDQKVLFQFFEQQQIKSEGKQVVTEVVAAKLVGAPNILDDIV
jgi:hypothetical protein